MDSVHPWAQWTIAKDGIFYFAEPDAKGHSDIRFYKFTTGNTKKILTVERSVDSEEESFPISNGQLHELVSQLQTLHQQSQELERRLSVLTNMVEHIQRSQNSRLSIEEVEELDTTEVPSAR